MTTYETRSPQIQNALDIFAGEWTSLLPSEFEGLVAGSTSLFADQRVTWAIDRLGGVEGKHVLELGPLEGGHSYMLERAGAESITAIEVNRQAFLRCLVIKEVTQLRRVSFLCGDFAPYLCDTKDRFDIVFASGVLYHQKSPMQMLADIARVAPAVYLWTHYFDAERIAANPHLESGKFGPLTDGEFDGRPYKYAEFRYLRALGWSGFSGGAEPQANWLRRSDITDSLRAYGFTDIEIAYDEPDHVNGPAFGLVARKRA